MKSSFFISPHFFWILLAAFNFIIQLAYFHNERKQGLFIAKKITTPLLLFFALMIVIIKSGGFPFIPSVILLAMGIGELGIEGSSAVQANEAEKPSETGTSPIVILSGVLFLLVNIFIGAVLLMNKAQPMIIITSLVIGGIIIAFIVFGTIKTFSPPKDIRTQTILYAIGLAVLFAGALADLRRGITTLGIAACLLTLSDTLVLIRMASGIPKGTPRGFKIQLAFLVVILILYYVYMGVLIQIKSPFPF